MKYYLIAGEASGDLHGSNLIKEIERLDAQAEFRCWGGEKMEQNGAYLVKHYRQLAFMGFAEVVKNLPAILRNLSFCKRDMVSFAPDVLILIDYPGFNLRIAKWAKQQGFKVVYYISPQVWAWKENRVKTIKRYVDKMLVILPFEKAFYQKWNYAVDYVGHPLVEVISDFIQSQEKNFTDKQPEDKNIIALLPGSRKQEIVQKLPIMLKVAAQFPDYRFIVAKAPGTEESFYTKMLGQYRNVSTVSGKTYNLLCSAKAALVTSGTATLETALFEVPQIICYKGGNISYQIAKRLVKIKYIGLVNLIMDKEVVKELIQNNLTEKNLAFELGELLNTTAKLKAIKEDYKELKGILTEAGPASCNAAKIIVAFCKSPLPPA
ncbi:MAG TPA: lipid-A-disaccharide synthase [Ferruginibacter sp.]|nr:lipid-A-disaccharide synthase [Ferruginibacter sp.]